MPRVASLRSVVVCVVALWAVGCAREVEPATPAETVGAFSSAIEASASDTSARRRVYALLSHRAQASLEARAARASQVSGRAFEAWEMLAPGRARMLIQYDASSTSTRIAGTRAVVTARGRGGGVADVPLVFEDGRWRVDLALPSAVAPHANDPRPSDPAAQRPLDR
jgi:hypothetical protein